MLAVPLPRARRHPDDVRRRLLAHLAGTLEERPLLDGEVRRRQVREHARLRVELDALRRDDVAPERAIDREPLHLDLRFDVGVLAYHEVAARRDLSLELPVDAEPVVELEISRQVASAVQKPVQRGSLGLHGTSFLGRLVSPRLRSGSVSLGRATLAQAVRTTRSTPLPIRTRSRLFLPCASERCEPGIVASGTAFPQHLS